MCMLTPEWWCSRERCGVRVLALSQRSAVALALATCRGPSPILDFPISTAYLPAPSPLDQILSVFLKAFTAFVPSLGLDGWISVPLCKMSRTSA